MAFDDEGIGRVRDGRSPRAATPCEIGRCRSRTYCLNSSRRSGCRRQTGMPSRRKCGLMYPSTRHPSPSVRSRPGRSRSRGIYPRAWVHDRLRGLGRECHHAEASKRMQTPQSHTPRQSPWAAEYPMNPLRSVYQKQRGRCPGKFLKILRCDQRTFFHFAPAQRIAARPPLSRCSPGADRRPSRLPVTCTACR